MKFKNIFSRSAADEVTVPEIQVDGDRLRIQRPEPEVEVGDDSYGQTQNNRDLRLPKTTWFADHIGEGVARNVATLFPKEEE